MLTLLEIQREMRDSVLAGPSRQLLAEIKSDRVSARRRLRVYRNHFRVSLIEGVESVFPATRVLLGERYFETMAELFVATCPPNDPRLFRYGREFPKFLRTRNELESSMFAIDVARLEWAVAELFDAPDTPLIEWIEFQNALTASAGAITLKFAPSVAIFESEWAAHEIRARALLGLGVEGIAPLVACPAPAQLLLHRDLDGDPCELPLDDAGFTALRLLLAGRSVNQATRAAYATNSDYPITDLFRFLIQSGALAGLSPIKALHRDANQEI